VTRGEGKRLFLGLLLALALVLGLLGVGVWLGPRWFSGAETVFLTAFGVLFGTVALVALAGIAVLAFAIVFERDLPGTRRLRGLVVKGAFPVLVVLGRMVGVSKERLERSFIAVNNQLVIRSGRRARPGRLLILLPHCLQVDTCGLRITSDIHNCRGCGRCPIAGLVEIGERHGVSLSVATGGTIARRTIVEKRPDLIVAVACERDLASGIQDAYPLPVYGILNRRPEGPCRNTLVDLTEVERAVEFLLASGSAGRDRAAAGAG